MEEIINLEKNTKYDEDEIKEWFRLTSNRENFVHFESYIYSNTQNLQSGMSKLSDEEGKSHRLLQDDNAK